MTAPFLDRLERGRTTGENPVAALLGRLGYTVRAATLEEQSRGLDHVGHRAGQPATFETKSSSRMGYHFLQLTGPGLCEQGWLFTSEAGTFALVTTSEQGERYCLLCPKPELQRVVMGLVDNHRVPVVSGAPLDSGRPGGTGVWVTSAQIQPAAYPSTIFWLPKPGKQLEAEPRDNSPEDVGYGDCPRVQQRAKAERARR